MVIRYNYTRRIRFFRSIYNCGLLKRKISMSGNNNSKNIMEKFKLPARHEAGAYNVWIEFTQLAVTTKSLNLGQGFPDYDPPSRFTNFLAQVATEKNSFFNQYTRGFGHVRLVQALSKLYSSLINRQIDPMNEILVTVGAYEALYCAIQSNIDNGDEAIIIEPSYDCYEPMIRTAGGIPRFIPLRNTKPDASVSNDANDWKLDPEELASLFNTRTKIIIINTPHNPLGKVFDYEELTMIADLAKKHNVLVISDEVYEWLVYEPTKHIRIASLPEMYDRTITIGSAGKTFSMTGWKLGWAYGPAALIKNLCVVHQTAIYTCPTTTQEAVARCFEHEIGVLNTPDSYFQNISKELKPKMQYLTKILRDNDFEPIIPNGGYFMIADWTKFENKINLNSETDRYKDFKFVKWLAKNVKLQGIPFSAFYSQVHKHMAENYLRFCFFKKDETLKDAENILSTWTNGLSKTKSKL